MGSIFATDVAFRTLFRAEMRTRTGVGRRARVGDWLTIHRRLVVLRNPTQDEFDSAVAAQAALAVADGGVPRIVQIAEGEQFQTTTPGVIVIGPGAGSWSGEFPTRDANGIVHLYTSATGSDTAIGSATAPLLTWQAAFNRYADWLRLGLDDDFHIHLHAATVTEAVRCIPSAVARGRLRVTGDMTAMTTLASGTIDAVAPTDWGTEEIEDASAAFGVARELIGYPVRIWDPSDEAATEQWSTVADHDATHLAITGLTVYHVQMLAGWSYRVCRPSTRIDSSSLAAPCMIFDGLRHSVRQALDDTGNDQPEHHGAVVVEFVEFIRTDDWMQPASQWRNVAVTFCGCVWSGTSQAIVIDSGNGAFGGLGGRPVGADALLDLAALEYSRYSCSIGVRRAPFGGIAAVLAKHSTVTGSPVVIGTHSVGLDDSMAQFSGGAIHLGDLELFMRSWCRVFGMLFKNTPANHKAIEVNPNPLFGNAYVEIIGTVVIDGALGDAIAIGAGGRLVVGDDAAIITGPNGIAGRGIVAKWGGQAALGQNTTALFTTTGANIDVDGITGTFAGLVEGSAIERAGYSGARVYRAEEWV